MLEEQQLPIQHARLALSSLASSGQMLDQIFAGSGLSLEAITRSKFPFSTRTLVTVADNVARLFGEAWFIGMPVLWSLRVQSEFGSAIRFSATLGEGLAVAAEFTHVRWPLGRLEIAREGDHAVVDMRAVDSLSQRNARMVAALAALNLQTTVAAMIGDDVARLRYEFPGPPPDYAPKLAALLTGASSWGHAGTRLLVPEDMMTRASLTADEISLAAMIQALRALAAARAAQSVVSEAVRGALRGAGEGGFDAGAIAEAVGLARRTMERRLRQEGTSFRALQDEVFKERLLALVADHRETAESVAERLGYHDASSLQRACRRWFGKTFGRIKQDLRARR